MQHTSKLWLRDLLLLTIIISILFGIFLGSFPLIPPDEARYSEIPREMVTTSQYITPHLNGVKYFEKPALFYWMQCTSIKLFGLSEWSMRLMNAFMGLLGCLIVYTSGRKLFDRRTGFLASLILATTAIYFGVAHVVTLDMTLTTLLSCALFSFILGTKTTKHRNYYMWAMYVFVALATMTKGLIGIVFPGIIIFFWILLFNKWREIKTYCIPTGILIFLLIAAPWHILVQIKNPEFFQFYFIKQHFLRYLSSHVGHHMPIAVLPAILLLGWFPWIAFSIQAINHNLPRSWQEFKQHEISIFLMLWPLLIFLFYSFSESLLVPYLLPIFPPLAILTANYFSKIWEQKFQRGITIGFTIILILSIIAATAVANLHHFISSPNPEKTKITFYIISLLIMFSAIYSYINYRRHGLPKAFSILIITMSLVFISLYYGAQQLDLKSIKPLTVKLMPLLKPNDEVASYDTYYQDLPFYLRRRVTVVNWKSELSFGMQHQDTSQWMIDTQTFWKRWNSKNRIFMITHQKTYIQLLKNSNKKMYFITKSGNNILVSNHRGHT